MYDHTDVVSYGISEKESGNLIWIFLSPGISFRTPNHLLSDVHSPELYRQNQVHVASLPSPWEPMLPALLEHPKAKCTCEVSVNVFLHLVLKN